jgi:hypothetical protein
VITIDGKEYQDADLAPEQIHLANQALACQNSGQADGSPGPDF